MTKPTTVFTVAQVNRYMKRLMEDDTLLAGLFVEGELSNVNCHRSGHVYFTLKDESAAVSGVMFKSQADTLAFSLENGMRVMVFGRFSLYEKTGQYQLYAEYMEPAGVGSLQMALEQLKKRLEAEGLFDLARKRPLPRYVSCVAVITSPTGAVVRDIIKIIKQRNPAIRIIIAPALVQGTEAGLDIARAIQEVNHWGKADLIIVGRGGGSVEDLWPFNEETTVRAVAGSKIPIVSAVGHETDFTLTDFAADERAPTPTAAAAAVYSQAETLAQVIYLSDRLHKLVPEMIYDRQMHVHSLLKDINLMMKSRLNKERAALSTAAAALEKVSPHALWKQGMALVRNKKGEPISSAVGLTAGTRLELDWPDGCIEVEVVREV